MQRQSIPAATTGELYPAISRFSANAHFSSISRTNPVLLPCFCNWRRVRIPGIQLRQTKVVLNRS